MKRVYIFVFTIFSLVMTTPVFAQQGTITVFHPGGKEEKIDFNCKTAKCFVNTINAVKDDHIQVGRFCRILGIGTIQKEAEAEKIYVELSCK